MLTKNLTPTSQLNPDSKPAHSTIFRGFSKNQARFKNFQQLLNPITDLPINKTSPATARLYSPPSSKQKFLGLFYLKNHILASAPYHQTSFQKTATNPQISDTTEQKISFLEKLLCAAINLLKALPKKICRYFCYFYHFLANSFIYPKSKNRSLAKFSPVFCLFFLLLFSQKSFAETESTTSREKVATSRNRKFFNSDRAKKVLGINGRYSSDYNSKRYEAGSRFIYQSYRHIHELNLNYDLEFADSGSGSNKKYGVKKKDEYDGILASKMRIKNTKYYGVLFHRTIYDDLSDYYYDIRNGIGLGRMFLDEKLELDMSGGYRQTKNFQSEFEMIGSIRLNKKLTPSLSIVQRGFFFVNHRGVDNEILTSLVFRLQNNLSLEIRHEFGKRRYVDDNQLINRVDRSVNVGLIFDLG